MLTGPASAFPARGGTDLSVEDVAAMSHVNEASIASLLITRFNKRHVYTQAGPDVLIAVNPRQSVSVELPRATTSSSLANTFPFVTSLYDPAVMQRYFEESSIANGPARSGARGGQVAASLGAHRSGPDGGLPPHVFALTDKCMRSLENDRVSQSILFTGESDSGKTENLKQSLRYAACVSRARCHAESRHVPAAEAAETILSEFPTVLEALGSAPSAGNPSSSR